MVKRLLVAAAWFAAASTPMCMLSLDKTDDGITVCCRFCRRMPSCNWPLSSLHTNVVIGYELLRMHAVSKTTQAIHKMRPSHLDEVLSRLRFARPKTTTYKSRNNDLSSVAYLMNKTASPAWSLFALTKTLHPVVSRCLRGWPTEKVKTK